MVDTTNSVLKIELELLEKLPRLDKQIGKKVLNVPKQAMRLLACTT